MQEEHLNKDWIPAPEPTRPAFVGGGGEPDYKQRFREGEHIAANIVYQIGDLLSEHVDVDPMHFAEARQKTNDRAIDFAAKLIDEVIEEARADERKRNSRYKQAYEDGFRDANAALIEKVEGMKWSYGCGGESPTCGPEKANQALDDLLAWLRGEKKSPEKEALDRGYNAVLDNIALAAKPLFQSPTQEETDPCCSSCREWNHSYCSVCRDDVDGSKPQEETECCGECFTWKYPHKLRNTEKACTNPTCPCHKPRTEVSNSN